MEEKNFIYGIRSVIEAIKSGKKIEKMLLKKGSQGLLFSELFQLSRENEINFQFVPPEKLDRITKKNHQGVIAFVQLIEYIEVEEVVQSVFEKGKIPLLLILDGITDVRNVGSIARSAECGAVDGIIFREKGSAQINNDAIKTSAGALFKIPVSKVKNLEETVKYLKNSGLQIVAATEKKDNLLYNVDFKKPTAIILGAEDTGISAELLKIADVWAKIPILGKISSLNVSNAATVFVFEAVRQRL